MKPESGGVRGRVEIRAASVNDAPDVTRIYVDSWNAGFGGLMPPRRTTPELAGRWRQVLVKPEPNRWWAAELEGTVVGFVGAGPSRYPAEPGLGELDTIAVDPGHWRLGIGRTLMSVALRRLAADGYREAVLWTLAGYERGQRFYEAAGRSPDGATRDGGRQIRYRLILTRRATFLDTPPTTYNDNFTCLL